MDISIIGTICRILLLMFGLRRWVLHSSIFTMQLMPQAQILLQVEIHFTICIVQMEVTPRCQAVILQHVFSMPL